MSDPGHRFPVIAQDVRAADWLVEALDHAEYTVASLLPRGYAAYARILHPAEGSGRRVRWSEVARWSGHDLTPETQFGSLSKPLRGAGPRPSSKRRRARSAPRPFTGVPRDGSLPEPELATLCAILADHTSTPDECWFCVWNGYGWLDPSQSTVMTAIGLARRPPEPSRPTPPADYLANASDAPLVHMPGREFLLLTGPLRAASLIGSTDAGGFLFEQSPNFCWPRDRSWCVATEIDLDSTHVAGPASLIDALLTAPSLEVLPTTPNTRAF
ncbi:hypothetical protein EDD29_4792 [Actinocorallia herbida]|uniref:Uncharacterized protein n=1 Tax=Actinocorallia herbida TaxID=58109 RepID=A0A3N1D295_9ACTN|nr:hypothetical protein [Actinocorallia herbida]ROO87198.1 hypothetical protein EDD29_4792 [Actinocorallia herbida]